MGTREAIHRDRMVINPMSQTFCPHEWLDGHGNVDRSLAASIQGPPPLACGSLSLRRPLMRVRIGPCQGLGGGANAQHRAQPAGRLDRCDDWPP